ncbi:MAG: rod shape-determining protein MreC [Planctomycetota bacterium]
MPAPTLSPKRLLLGVAVLLVVNAQLPTPAAGFVGGVTAGVVRFVTLPLTAPLHAVSVGLRGDDAEPPTLAGGAMSEAELREAYALSRVEVDRLRQRVGELEDTLALLEGVRSGADTPTRPLSARVTASADAGPGWVLTINRGSRHGVEPGMTAVTGASLVGRVLDPVGPATAEVELVTAHDAGLQVRIRPRGSDLVFDNVRVRRAEDNPGVFYAEVAKDPDSPIRAGADVLLADAVHYADARGRLLGVVENITEYPDDPELLRRLVVRPAVDLRYLRELAVLLPAEE